MRALRVLEHTTVPAGGTTTELDLSGPLVLVTAIDDGARVYTTRPAGGDASTGGVYIPRDDCRLLVLEPSGALWVYTTAGGTANVVTCEMYRPEEVP